MPEPRDSPEPSTAADGPETVETSIEPEANGLRHVRVEIRRALAGRRLDKYLSGRLGRETSRTALQRYIREGNVTVNEAAVKPSYAIRPGDVIDMALPLVRPQEIPPEPIPLDVVYEDDDIIAVTGYRGADPVVDIMPERPIAAARPRDR